MADDRLTLGVDQVRRLVAAQFPQWADLPVTTVAWSGWDNHTFRLGDRLKLRLPSAVRYVAAVQKELAVVPRLAGRLPVAIPEPMAVGVPGEGYPFPWSIWTWIDGELPYAAVRTNLALARQAGQFLTALRAIDAAGGPPAGAHNFHRGGDLRVYDAETHATLDKLGDRVDVGACRLTWATALASHWTGPPVWVHGDFALGNLLVEQGRLKAVIDWGTSAVGDPASDLVLAWTFFEGEVREAFREAAGLDDATWARARGWALWKALLTVAGGGIPHPVERGAAMVIEDVIAGR